MVEQAIRRGVLKTMVLLLLSVPAIAGDANEQSWAALKQLSAGQKVTVVQKELKSHEGTFVSVSAESVVIHENKIEVSLQRVDVLRITARGKPKRLRNALIGALVGSAAAGAAARSGEAVFLGFWPGLVIGALLPVHASHTIYRAQE